MHIVKEEPEQYDFKAAQEEREAAEMEIVSRIPADTTFTPEELAVLRHALLRIVGDRMKLPEDYWGSDLQEDAEEQIRSNYEEAKKPGFVSAAAKLLVKISDIPAPQDVPDYSIDDDSPYDGYEEDEDE